jgi:hypothetical protein
MAALLDVKISTQGTLFRDNAPQVVESEMTAWQKQIGLVGVRLIQTRFDKVVQHPTGHYRSRIDFRVVSRNVGSSLVELHDSGVIYGPWLEGISRRNRVSRFKGYSTFRKSLQDLEKMSTDELERTARTIARKLES